MGTFWRIVKEIELSFLGIKLLGGREFRGPRVPRWDILQALDLKLGWLAVCRTPLWGKASKWTVFLMAGMRGDTSPVSFWWVWRPSMWLREKEVLEPEALRGCISGGGGAKSWSIQAVRLSLRPSQERRANKDEVSTLPPPNQQMALPARRDLIWRLVESLVECVFPTARRLPAARD